MKKLIPILLIISILALPCASLAAAPEFDDPSVESVVSAVLIEGDTGQILYEKNQDERIYPASTTKLMTALLLVEQKGNSLDEEVTVGNEVNYFGSGSSLMYLRQGETLTLKDLLYGLMLPSGNDAAAAIAVVLAGGEDAFCAMMNERARELGMENTQFVNSCGMFMNQDDVNSIPEEKLGYHHYSTAADMSKLAQAVLQRPEIMEVVGTQEYTVPYTNMHTADDEPWVMKNSNLLLRTPMDKHPEYERYIYDGATGMKTGLVNNIVVDPDTGERIDSYGCLVASATRGDLNLIALVFGDTSNKSFEGAPESSKRWDVTTELFDYGFQNYAWTDLSQYIQPVTLNEQVANFADNDPQEGVLTISSVAENEKPGRRLVDKATADGLADGSIAVETETSLLKALVAPIDEGEEMGRVTYSLEGEDIYESRLVAERQVYELGEEKETQEEYNLSTTSTLPEYWWLWIAIPGAAIGGLLGVRAITEKTAQKSRSRGRGGRRGYYEPPRAVRPMTDWKSELDGNKGEKDDPWTRRKL